MTVDDRETTSGHDMKRTFWFGVLAVPAAVSYIISVIAILTVVGAPNPNNMIVTRRDERVYKVLIALFMDGYLYILFPAAIVAFTVWLAWRKGFLKKVYIKFWQVIVRYAHEKKGGWPGMAARVAVAALAGYACYWLSGKTYLYTPPEGILRMVRSFGNVYGTVVYFTLLLAPMVPLSFSAVSFAHAVMSSNSWPEFRRKSLVPLAGMSAMVVLALSFLQAQGYLDIDKDISFVPGVSFDVSPRQLVVLNEIPFIKGMDDMFQDKDAFPFSKGDLPYNENNTKAVRAYLDKRDGTTALRGTIYNYLIYSRMRVLDPIEAVKLYDEAFSATGEAMFALMEMQHILNGPAVPANLEALRTFSENPDYVINGRCALRVARMYNKFGKTDEALYWYEKGMGTGQEIDDDLKKSSQPADDTGSYRGQVTGRLLLDGRAVEGRRVGIMKKKSADYLAKTNSGEYDSIDPHMGLYSLIAGTGTGPDGGFVFDGLGENEYVILLSLEDVPGMEFSVPSSPGPVSISEENPAVDVGSIDIVLRTKVKDGI